MSAAVRIRAAGPDDAARVAGLAGELGYPQAPAVARERIRSIAGDPDRSLALACITPAADGAGREEVVGWLALEFRESILAGPVAEVVGLVVGAGARRCGAGRALVAWAEAETRRRGIATLQLRSNAQRVEAGLFYPALGFEMTKLSRNFVKRLT